MNGNRNRYTSAPLYGLKNLERLWLNHASFYKYGTPADLSKARIRQLKKALPAIVLGVLAAAGIMTLVTFGAIHLF